MSLMDFPEIELTVRAMQHKIIIALHDYQQGLEEKIKEEVEKQIAAYDFEKEVAVVTEQALKGIVGEAVRELFDYDMRQEIRNMVKEFVRNKINS